MGYIVPVFGLRLTKLVDSGISLLFNLGFEKARLTTFIEMMIQNALPNYISGKNHNIIKKSRVSHTWKPKKSLEGISV